MPNHGRLLHAKHLFPFVFAPWFQFRRLLLRLDWALFVPLRIASLWTASAVCGVIGVIGAILLFLFNAPPTPVAASTAEPTVVERIAITIPTDLGPPVPMAPISVPVPVPTRTTWSDVQLRFVRTHLPRGWDLRERQELVSRPEPFHPQSLYAIRDGWFAMNFNRQAQFVRDTIQPYVSRPGVLASQILPPFTAAESVDPTQPVTKNRHPAIVVAHEEEARASLHHETSYSLVVANPSPELIESAIVEERISALHRVVNTDPPASLTADGSALQWNVANLRPGENRRLRVTLMPESSDPIQHQTFVTVTSRVAASTTIRQPYVPPENPVPIARPTPPPAPVRQPILELDLERPQQVDVGGDVRAYYVVRNIGNAPATDVVTYVTISTNLDHRYGEYLEHRIPELPAGETRRIKFYAVGARPGIASLTSRLSASNAQPVSRVFEIAIAATGPGRSNSIAQPGGPGVTDPNTFPGSGGFTGTPNTGTPFPAPPGPGGSVPRSTLPSVARPDRDDGLPTRVPSTVPGQPGIGQPGPVQIGSGQTDGGIWRGTPGEQPGPMTSPFGPGSAPDSGFSTTPDPRTRSTLPNTPRPDPDDTLPLRVQSTVPESSGPAGSVPRGSLPAAPENNAPYGQETSPFQAFPPGATPTAPGSSDSFRRNEGFRPGETPSPDRSGWRPGRSSGEFAPEPTIDPRFVPDQGGFPGGQPSAPFPPANGSPFPSTGPSFNPQNGSPADLGEAQPLPRSPERSRGPGRPVPPEDAAPSSSPFDPQSGSPFNSPPPGLGAPAGNDRFAPPTEVNPGMNRPFVPTPATNPAGTPLVDPFSPPDSSFPRPNSKPVFIPEPVPTTIPEGGRPIGPMPMVDPQVYPSLLPSNEFIPAGGPQPFAPPSPFSPAAPEPGPAEAPKAI